MSETRILPKPAADPVADHSPTSAGSVKAGSMIGEEEWVVRGRVGFQSRTALATLAAPDAGKVHESKQESDEIVALRLQNARLTLEVELLSRLLSGILASRSWRFTAPFRRLGESLPRWLPITLPRGAGEINPVTKFELDSGLGFCDIGRVAHDLANVAEHYAAMKLRGTPRVLVILHVFYADLLAEMMRRLVNVDEPFDLAITLTDQYSSPLGETLQEIFPGAAIFVLPNQGRDIRPLVHVISRTDLLKYDVVLKLHTKRSSHRPDGHLWRHRLVMSLLPDPEGVRKIVARIRRDRRAALAVPNEYLLGPGAWGSNYQRARDLAGPLGVSLNRQRLRFPAGSMFWAKPEILIPFGQLDVPDVFEPESGQVDGTTAHAVERLIGFAARQQGRRIVKLSGRRVARLARGR